MKKIILLSLRENVADSAFARLENLKRSKEESLNQLAAEIEELSFGSEQLQSMVFDMGGQADKLSRSLLKSEASERELDENIKELEALQDPDIDQVFAVKAPLHRQ